MMRLHLFIILFVGILGENFSQSAPEALANGQDLNVLYRHEGTFKFFVHTRGVGAGYRRGKHVSGKTKSLIEFEGLTLKHPKEVKVKGNEESSKRFVYGKLNSVFELRAGTGFQNVIFKRADRKSIEIRTSYILGLTVAIAKPYYVLVYRGSGPQRMAQSVKYDSDRLTQDSVIGHGPFVDGLNEIAFYPGISGKFNVSFEYAPYSDWVRAIETGVNLDYYPKALPIMAKNPPENLILTLYVGFVFGKKWF